MTPEERLLATTFFEVAVAEGEIWRLRDARGERARARAENRTPPGYLMVRQMVSGRRLHVLAHRVVWCAAHGPIRRGLVINHLNGRKDDNRLANLELTTQSGNSRHAHDVLGKFREQRGEANAMARLTAVEVEEIRRLYSTGEHLQVELAARFGVAFQTISKVVRGERWSSQGGATSTADHRHNVCERDPGTGRFIHELPEVRP